MAELDDKFVELWAKHAEPKMAEKKKEFENGIKQLVGSYVKTEVDRFEKKVDTGFAEVKESIEGLKKPLCFPSAPSCSHSCSHRRQRGSPRSSPFTFVFR